MLESQASRKDQAREQGIMDAGRMTGDQFMTTCDPRQSITGSGAALRSTRAKDYAPSPLAGAARIPVTAAASCTAAAPNVIKAAETQRAESEARSLLAGIGDFGEVTVPVAEWQRLAGRAVRWLEVVESIVTDLHRIRYSTKSEQIDGRIVVFERAMDRCSTILTGVARLNLDERSVKVREAQVALLAGRCTRRSVRRTCRTIRGRRSWSG